ncbi:MAG TPA: hypothetical protein VF581_00240 [Flavobacterium sp.]
MLVCSGYSQVGIGTTAPEGALDVKSSNSGVLVPRVALSSRLVALPVTNPQSGSLAEGTLVWNTATSGSSPNNVAPGFYFWNGSEWTAISAGSDKKWSLSGNSGTLPATEFIGTTDAAELKIKTSNTERFRVLANGQIIVNNTAAPAVTDQFSVYSTTNGVSGYSSGTGTASIFGEASGPSGRAVLGRSTNATGFGVFGRNLNPIGTGIIGAGNNFGGFYLNAGSGGAFAGTTTGVYAYYTSGVGQGILVQDAFAGQWNIGFYNGALYKIIGQGAVSTIVKDLENQDVVMHCTETPENLFEDYGTGQLITGKAHIIIDPILAKNIIVNEQKPLKVFVQLEGECNGVYVTNKTAQSFDVIELQGGTSNTKFSYSIVATRADETYISAAGETRIAKYGARFEKAPERQEVQSADKR